MDPFSGADAFRRSCLVRGASCAGATDVGRVRARNEDAYWISADASLLVVADGLGGLPAGDTASAVAVETVAAQPALDAGAADLAAENWLRAAVDAAQHAVLAAAAADPARLGMATTLVTAALERERLTVMHVGDSRAMLWRNGRLLRTTFDHNSVGDLLKAGTLDSDEARHHPDRFQIREVVGLPGGFHAEVQAWPVERGDLVLLCTDGVSDALSCAEIGTILAVSTDPMASVLELVRAAGEAGGYDNATAVLRCVT